MVSLLLADIHITIQQITILNELGTSWVGVSNKWLKSSKKDVDGEAKTADEVSLVEAHFVNIRMASSIIVIGDPNLDQQRELKPIPNSPLVFPFQSTENISSFVGS